MTRAPPPPGGTRRPPGGDEPQFTANEEGAQCEADSAEFMWASRCPAGIYALTPKLITIAVDPAPPSRQGGHIDDLQSVLTRWN